MHTFFVSEFADFRTSESHLVATNKLNDVSEILIKGHHFINQVLQDYAKDFDINYSQVTADLFNNNLENQ